MNTFAGGIIVQTFIKKNYGKTILNYIYYILFVSLLWNIYELYFFRRYKYLINKYFTFLIIYFDLYENIFHSNCWFIWIIIPISHNIYIYSNYSDYVDCTLNLF